MPEQPGPRPPGIYLAFDFGLRRIGIAAGQTQTGTATALDTVRHAQAPDWPAIDTLVAEWRPVGLVVGLPLDSEGNDTDMSKAARAFADELSRRYGRPAYLCDERLSSRAADEAFVAMRAGGQSKRKDAARLDALAARIILENWLAESP
jgi:putative Holliday junction resolvase